MDCQALLLERDLTMRVGGRALPELGEGDALVEVEWAGLCGSDLHVMRTGDWVTCWPATLGHEIYGRVQVAPPGAELVEGTAVVADSRIPCGGCPACLAPDPDRCNAIQFVGEGRPGGFATHCVLPVRMLQPVSEGVEGSIAVLAEPLAVAVHAIGHLVGTPERVALLGHGPIGALIHAELRRRFPECEVEVAEPAPLRAALARAWGARCAAGSAELAGRFDVVVDAAGYHGSLRDAIGLCDHDGQLALVALGEHEVALRPMDIVEKRLRITGVNAFRGELPLAVELLAREGWRYAPVVTDAVALSELPEKARRQLECPDGIKVLVRP
jgi:threonine dehydrogenase-like Zn-dependent dehydrogenase